MSTSEYETQKKFNLQEMPVLIEARSDTDSAFGVNEQGFGNSAKHFVGDLNNDGKADFIAYEPWTGNWDISINNAGGFVSTVNFEIGFEANVDFATVYDVDNNGSGDLVIVGDDGDAWVRYLNNNLSKVWRRIELNVI